MVLTNLILMESLFLCFRCMYLFVKKGKGTESYRYFRVEPLSFESIQPESSFIYAFIVCFSLFYYSEKPRIIRFNLEGKSNLQIIMFSITFLLPMALTIIEILVNMTGKIKIMKRKQRRKKKNINPDLIEYLLKQGIFDEEIDEFLKNFDSHITLNDLSIVAVFNSISDVGYDYLHKKSKEKGLKQDSYYSFDFSDAFEKGKNIISKNNEYIKLSSGRIIKVKPEQMSN